jgi:hypothetical protein
MKTALFAVSFSALLDHPQSDGMELSRSHSVALRRFLTPGITRREALRAASNLAHDIHANSGRVQAVVMW